MWSLWQFIADLHGPTTVVLVAAALLGYTVLTQQRLPTALRVLPRPASTLPLLGNALDLLIAHRTRIHDWLLDECLCFKGRPWLLASLGGDPSIVLTQESHFEDVLKTHFDAFEKGPKIRDLGGDFFGNNGIFVADGAAWRHQRKAASHLFSHHMMRECMAKAIAEDTRVVLQKLATAQATGAKIELKLLMDALTTDVFTKIGFGVRLGCLDDFEIDHHKAVRAAADRGGDEAQNVFDGAFHRAFSRCPMVIQARSQQPAFLWKLKRWLQVGDERQLTHDMKRINGAIFKVIQDSIARSRSGDTTAEMNLISLFLAKAHETSPDNVDDEEEKEQTTPEMIRDTALNFIAAGRGTTGQSLAWCVIMLSRYPAVYDKVLEELQRELPQLFDPSDDYVPSMEDAASLTYLEAVIKESLRLNPAAPLTSRVAIEDTVLTDGTFVPKGVRVVFPTYAAARMPWLWGEDAAAFRPDRWIDETTGKLRQVSPCKFLVFHGGPRICLGVKLAMLEMKIALAAMLSQFEFVLDKDPFEITYDMSLSLPIRGELLASVHPVRAVGTAPPAVVA